MSLASALTSARNSLATRSGEADVVSRNIAGVNEAGYTRKKAEIVTGQPGGVRLAAITRDADPVLFASMTRATSDAAMRQSLLAGISRLQQTVDPALGDSVPSARMGALQDALVKSSATPSDAALAQNAVEKAQALARTLQESSALVQGVRQQADADMAESVSKINNYLAQFHETNTRIVVYSASGRDITSDLDRRDQILQNLADELGIRTTQRPNGDMQIYTDSGITLFDTSPRNVSFSASSFLSAGVNGQAVTIDGMSVTGSDSVMGLQTGRLAGLAQLRDQDAPLYQSQLDEMARGLVIAFAEVNQAGGGARAGLFRNGNSLTLPGSGLVNGIAAALTVAPTVDRMQGGNPLLLRDGGISDPADPSYRLNTKNSAAFSDRLDVLARSIETPLSFDPKAGSIVSGTLSQLASSSTGWIENKRQTVTAEAEQKGAFLDRSKQALSNETGVNLDMEMSKMLELERAYQGSAKLISTIDNMLAALLKAAG
jgi:flagellar hook-associated protein 1 FlgK